MHSGAARWEVQQEKGESTGALAEGWGSEFWVCKRMSGLSALPELRVSRLRTVSRTWHELEVQGFRDTHVYKGRQAATVK